MEEVAWGILLVWAYAVLSHSWRELGMAVLGIDAWALEEGSAVWEDGGGRGETTTTMEEWQATDNWRRYDRLNMERTGRTNIWGGGEYIWYDSVAC